MYHSAVLFALIISLTTTLLGAAVSRADDFPDPDKLPSIKELPDPLVMRDGTRVTTKEEWLAKRKPELRALFQHYMYGDFPVVSKIEVTDRSFVRSVDKDCLGGKATMKQITVRFGALETPKIDLLLFVPNKRADKRPPPVVLGMNFSGNHSVLNDPRISIPTHWMPDFPDIVKNHATESGRGDRADQWQIEHVIDRGYAVATFNYCDFVPDKPGEKELGPTDTGAICAWAGGLQRAAQYLVHDADVDGQRIVVFGHSRNGKAALLAGAFDEGIAAVIAHQAGCGGSGPSRSQNPKAESVTAINKRFPHWFDGNFKKFSGHEDRLPFDQDCLVALCAPRPVLFTAGTEDEWANPPGQLDVLRAASPVYKLFGLDGIGANETPENDKLIGHSLCYFIRESKHTMDRAYWDVFLDFVDKSLAGK